MKLRVKLFGKNILIAGSKYEKKIDYADYYCLSAGCKNCGTETIVYIKKGVHLNDVITAVKCIKCECRLEKQENK